MGIKNICVILGVAVVFVSLIPVVRSLCVESGGPFVPKSDDYRQSSRRRDVLVRTAATAATVLTTSLPANALGLAAKLSERDPAALKNSIFNAPPAVQVYPPFMRGEWEVTMKFNGFLFPSTTIPKSTLTADTAIPGFQKCSIVAMCDVGKELTQYKMKISEASGLENRTFTLTQQINSNLGYSAIRNIAYDPTSNPNRLSISFIPNQTRNANQVELFCNARESELVPNSKLEGKKIFVCSEYVRQVTFGLSQEFGVAREVVGNYAHFSTWKEQQSPDNLEGNILTAAYLDPQDALFFQEPSKPVAIYSHTFTAKRVVEPTA